MGFRAADAVVAIWDIRSTVTGQCVRAGDRGVVLKQVGTEPVSFKVRFTVEGRSVILDGLTRNDITRDGPDLGDPLEADQEECWKTGFSTRRPSISPEDVAAFG